jgi:hypothetical protein
MRGLTDGPEGEEYAQAEMGNTILRIDCSECV